MDKDLELRHDFVHRADAEDPGQLPELQIVPVTPDTEERHDLPITIGQLEKLIDMLGEEVDLDHADAPATPVYH